MPRIAGRSTADHIAEVAGRIFFHEGIEHIAVDRVADLAGVTKRTLYKHFRSKDALLAAAITRESPLAIRETAGTPEERIAQVFRQLVDFVSAPEYRGCPFFQAAARFPDAQHPARIAIRRIKDRRRSWFHDRVAELGVADAETLADQLAVLFDGALASSTVRSRPEPALAAAQAVPHLLRAALRESKPIVTTVSRSRAASAA